MPSNSPVAAAAAAAAAAAVAAATCRGEATINMIARHDTGRQGGVWVQLTRFMIDLPVDQLRHAATMS
jgi:hypothetical protein